MKETERAIETSDQKLVIVGAGHAGGRMAEALRANGFQGSIVLIGEEDWPPYERPPLSKDLLAGATEIDRLLVRPLSWYAEQGIEIVLGTRVESIDRSARSLLLSSGVSVSYDRLVLATGARARPLPIAGHNLPGVYYVRGIADTLALRNRLLPGTRLLVIGAGFIGLEVAAIARGLECEVTIVEAGGYPLGRVAPEEVGRFFADLHRSHGAELRFNTSITQVHRGQEGLIAHAGNGEHWHGDIIVAGIGAIPNTGLAEAADLIVENGVVTDEFGHTSDPAIFAVGDVTSHFNPMLGRRIRLETWQNAQNQAIAVGKVIAGGQQAYSEVPWFWTDQYGVNFQVAGAAQAWDEVICRGALEARQCTVLYLQQGRVVGGATVNNGRDMRFVKQLIAQNLYIDRVLLADTSQRLDAILKSATAAA